MKTLVIAALILICCLCHHSDGQIAAAPLLRSGCCQSNSEDRVPLRRITYMGRTPDDCPVQSVVIKTVRNKQICVDPEKPWVKVALFKFKESTANNKPTSAPFNM
ncbi:C-C motif chemokine 22-like [Betta splendens]|uniref:C-C motif chemokine 22-like n=1 Tax=Betta splendens TaxID=158456 RepID=A0A6P7M4W8_BETSP|nr:C-C motif chemokine 22-like [Betta splendens]